jgi:hypothetical protein
LSRGLCRDCVPFQVAGKMRWANHTATPEQFKKEK